MKKSLIDFCIRESMEAGVGILAGTPSPPPMVVFFMAVTDEFLRILKGINPEDAEAEATSCDDS